MVGRPLTSDSRQLTTDLLGSRVYGSWLARRVQTKHQFKRHSDANVDCGKDTLPARIAFCITTLETGGAERQLVELATRLPRDRFEPVVAVLSCPPSPPQDEFVQRLAKHAVPASFLCGRSWWQAPVVQRRLSQWLGRMRPDLLQCFLAHANVLGAWAARRLGIPIVTGIRVAEQRRNCHRLLQRWTAPLVDRHVCVSRSVAGFAEQSMGLACDKLIVIPNGVDIARFTDVEPLSHDELGLAPGRRVLLFVGRLEPDKRPDWLLERLPAITARLAEHDLVIVGRGRLEERLRRRAAGLGVADRVHFVGWRPDVPRWMAAADLVLLTSAAEGMPNVVLEAMAAGRPVVTTEVHGVEELLGEHHTRQVVPADSPSAFVEAVVRIAADRVLAARLGEQNRARATREFSFAAAVDRYGALYASLLATERH